MHEIGIVEELIASIQEKTKVKPRQIIKKVYLRLGQNSELNEESLRFWFNNLAKGTSLEEAVLDISLIDDKGLFVDSVETQE